MCPGNGQELARPLVEEPEELLEGAALCLEEVKRRLDVFGHFGFFLLHLTVITVARRVADKVVQLLQLGPLTTAASVAVPVSSREAAPRRRDAGACSHQEWARQGWVRAARLTRAASPSSSLEDLGWLSLATPQSGRGILPSRTSTTATQVFLSLITVVSSSWAPTASQALRAS